MYISDKASRLRQREAQRARDNRAEIVKARSQGQVTRRELVKWGIFTMTGALALKNGLSPFAPSSFAKDVPTGTPRSPLFGATKFSQPMRRLELQKPIPLTRNALNEAVFPSAYPEHPARRLSYHTDWSNPPNAATKARYTNPLTRVGPMEGRPPGEFFAHQRWDEFFPKVAYVMSMGQVKANTRFHPKFVVQEPNSAWTFGSGRFVRGSSTPPLIKARYGEPVLARIYNNLPRNRADNNGFGRNEISTHLHNAHNAAESDGATNAHFFPGTFFDYLWGTTLARRDRINTFADDPRASGPDGNGGLVRIPGDFREIQGSLWFHDHRFFFTAENVYKGNFGAINYYSGPDRGREDLNDGVNLQLPSGFLLDWGNVDFDVNLIVHDAAFSPDGQLFFDIFDDNGFLGDVMMVNMAYAPFFEVLPRKYRFRLLNACMSRFIKLVLVNASGTKIPFQFIANDGNLVVNSIASSLIGNELDVMATAERYDIVVDFSKFKVGDRLRLVNLQKQRDGRKPEDVLSIREALAGDTQDPGVGPLLEFRVVGSVPSVDVPGVTHYAPGYAPSGKTAVSDKSKVPATLTEQIPIVTPVRVREIEFKRDEQNFTGGNCLPDCEQKDLLAWVIRINGEGQHSLNANRISLLVPKPGEVEHWKLVNGGGGWDHPIHLHFEEGITINRGSDTIPVTEKLVRKDVWRLREGGTVTIQVEFGEFGGAYVQHCHNTVHEDFGMLMRLQLLADNGEPQTAITPTPVPSENGVTFMTPEILKEGDPRKKGGVG